jgi:hypothetical protein
MPALTWDAVRARRLRRNHLAGATPRPGAAEVAAAVCGQQAQVLSAAELGLARRAGLTRAEVRRALWEERTLVKAWTLRSTLHLVSSHELELWLAAQRALQDVPDTPAEAELAAAVGDALEHGPLTRGELAEAVVALLGEEHREPLLSGWGAALRPAARRGLLITGPSRGSEVTFVRPDRWLGRPLAGVDEREALLAVARRFASVYGPTRHDELCRFLGARPPVARTLLERLGCRELQLDGRRFLLAGDDDGFDEEPGGVHLLPQYDSYVIGFHPRSELLSGNSKARIAEHGRGRYEGVVAMRTVLVDGSVAGLWELRRSTVRVELHRDLARGRRRELQQEVERLGRIEGSELGLELGRLDF